MILRNRGALFAFTFFLELREKSNFYILFASKNEKKVKI